MPAEAEWAPAPAAAGAAAPQWDDSAAGGPNWEAAAAEPAVPAAAQYVAPTPTDFAAGY